MNIDFDFTRAAQSLIPVLFGTREVKNRYSSPSISYTIIIHIWPDTKQQINMKSNLIQNMQP